MKNKRNLLFSVLMASFLTSFPVAVAAFSPQDTQMLTQIYAQLKEQLDTLKDELEEVKFVSDELFAAREYLQAVRGEYEFATRFDPQGELNSALQWSNGLTNLDDLDDRSWQETWHLLSGEIDKRFERSSLDPDDKAAAKSATFDDLNEIQKTRYLEEFYRKQAMGGGQAETAKDMHRRTASSTSMMTSLMLEERAERLKREAVKRQQLIRQVEWDGEFVRYLEGDY